MLGDFRHSIGEVLRERTSGPFYGAFILSWLAVNWRVAYVTIFVKDESLPPAFHNKIEYIESLLCYEDLFWIPLKYTGLLVIVVPILAWIAYTVSLLFTRARIWIKGEILDKHQLLTKEQTDALWTEFHEKERRFEARIASKNDEIALKNSEIESLKEEIKKAQSPEQNTFQINQAFYGTGSANQLDVTEHVRMIFETTNSFVVENAALGGKDPAPGIVKTLSISYQSNGKPYLFVAKEHESVRLDRRTKTLR